MNHSNQNQTKIIPIRRKLLSATFLSAILAILIAVGGLYCMHQLISRLQNVVDVAAEEAKVTNLLRQNLASVIRAERNLFRVNDQAEFDRIATEMDMSFKSIDQQVSQLRNLFQKHDLKRLENFDSTLAKWRASHQQLRSFSGMNAQRSARELSLTRGDLALNEFEDTIGQLIDTLHDDADPDAIEQNPGANSSSDTNDAANEQENDPGNNNTNIEHLPANALTLLNLAELRYAVMKLQKIEKNLILNASISSVGDAKDSLRPFRKKIKDQFEATKRLLKDKELETFENAEKQFKSYESVLDSILDVIEGNRPSILFDWIRGSGASLAESCEKDANAMVSRSERLLDQYDTESTTLYLMFRNALVGLSLLAVAASTIVSLSVGTRVSNKIRALRDYANAVHQYKDLTRPVPVESDDEIGELAVAFDEMRVSLLRQSEELARLNKSLAHKNEDMEQFVYSVSHDLKSPLVSCKGLVGLINEDIDDGDFDEVKRSAGRLADVADQMSNTIDDLLTFSRLGRHPIEIHEVDIAKLIESLREEWQDRLEDKNIEIQVATGLPTIRSELLSIRRIFDNLIGNAVKYAGDGGKAKIEIGAVSKPAHTRFYVRDNGPGIEPQFHEKIFGLFQRLDNSIPGTGIGLASVAKLIRHLGGRVWVESEPGNGATFWFELPQTL